MAQLVYQHQGLAYNRRRLSVSAAYPGEGVLSPPAGFTGVVSAAVPGQMVTSPYNDPARSYVPLAAWGENPTYGGGMFFKEYFKPQDGSVYFEIEVFARIGCAVDFYVLVDSDDGANFAILESGRLLAQGNSSGTTSTLPQVRATVTLVPGLHTLRLAVLGGNSLYASKLTVRT